MYNSSMAHPETRLGPFWIQLGFVEGHLISAAVATSTMSYSVSWRLKRTHCRLLFQHPDDYETKTSIKQFEPEDGLQSNWGYMNPYIVRLMTFRPPEVADCRRPSPLYVTVY